MFKYPFWIFFFFSLLANIESLMGPYRPIPLHDTFDNWYVPLKINGDIFWSSGLVQWNPFSLTGNHALMLGFHPFNPFSLLSHFIPLWVIYSLWGFLVTLIAGYGMFLFTEKILRMSPSAAYVASSLFALASITLNQSEVFTYSLPLFLYCFFQSFEETKHKWCFFSILVLIIFCSFSPLTLPYFPLFHFFFILAFSPKQKLFQYLKGFFLVWLAYVAFHAPVIYSLISEASLSHRATFEKVLENSFFITFLKAISRTIREGSYVHFVCLILMFLSLAYRPFKKIAFFWLFLCFSFLILVIFSSPLKEGLEKYLFFLNTFSWARLFLVFRDFIFCILSAYGFVVLEKGYHPMGSPMGSNEKLFLYLTPQKILKIIFPSLILIYASTLFADYYLSTWRAPMTRRINLFFYSSVIVALFLSLILVKWRFFKKKIVFSLSVILFYLFFITKVSFSVSFYTKNFNTYFNSSVLKKLSEQKKDLSSERVAFYFYHFFQRLPSSLWTFYGLQTPETYQSLYPARYKKLWEKLFLPDTCHERERKAWKINFSQWGNRVFLPPGQCINFNLLSLYNIKFLISHHAPLEKNEEKVLRLFLKEDYHIYEFIPALPRTYLASHWEIISDEGLLLNTMAAKEPLEHVSHLPLLKSDVENIILPPSHKKRVVGEVKIAAYKPSSVVLEGYANEESIVVLLDQYHKHWKAFIDTDAGNQKVPIFPVHYIFRGIVVPKGKFTVTMVYDDPGLKVSYATILLGFFFLIVFLRYSTPPSVGAQDGKQVFPFKKGPSVTS